MVKRIIKTLNYQHMHTNNLMDLTNLDTHHQTTITIKIITSDRQTHIVIMVQSTLNKKTLTISRVL